MDESMIPSPDDIKAIGESIGSAANGGAAFIEQINKAMGSTFLVHKAKREVKAAKTKYEGIAELWESTGLDLPEEAKRALAFEAAKSIKGFENIDAIVAQMSIPEDNRASEIDDEWMSRFLDSAKEAFSGWKREILAKIGTAKAIDPDSISLDLLVCLSRMDEKDMQAFEKVCSLILNEDDAEGEPYIPAIDNIPLQQVGLNSKSIKCLRDKGLLCERTERLMVRLSKTNHMSESLARVAMSSEFTAPMRFKGREIQAESLRVRSGEIHERKTTYYLDLGVMEFTAAGSELSTLVNVRTNTSIEEYVNLGHAVVQKDFDDVNSHALFEKRKYQRFLAKQMKEVDRRFKLR